MRHSMSKPRTPLLTVDIIIKTAGGIVLIERKNYPNGWAIPGGFVDCEETLERAAIREAKEETGLHVKLVRQFHVYSDPERDSRGHTISTVFIATAKGNPKAGSDAKEIRIFTQKSLPINIAFDHRKILQDYFENRY
jgi:ADP-ribose pyrophosphatase YjhB (NUDIX family)